MTEMYWTQNPAGEPLVDCVITFADKTETFTFEYGDAFAINDAVECLGHVMYSSGQRQTLRSLVGEDTFRLLYQIIPVP